jgi:hypothetical protein
MTVEYDELDPCWHLMVTYSDSKEPSRVCILQNLRAQTARQAYRRLCPQTHPVRYINVPPSGNTYSGTISYSSSGPAVDILGPEGADLDPWRGVEPRVIDLIQMKEAELELIEAKKKAKHFGLYDRMPEQCLALAKKAGFDCVNCGEHQDEGELRVRLPKDILETPLPLEDIENIQYRHYSGGLGPTGDWCADCAPKEGRWPPKKRASKPAGAAPKKRPWWKL